MDEQKEVVYISHNDKITSENVNCYYEDGLTPLTYVLVNDYYERAEKYLELGADPYLKDLKGRFPIDIVLQTYRYYIISLLLEHGFDIKHRFTGG